MGAIVPVTGSGALAALDSMTVLPSGETASTLPTKGSSRLTTFVEVSRAASPWLVPREALAPLAANTMELGTAHAPLGQGMLIGVPAADAAGLVVSMGRMVGVGLAVGGANVVVA